MNARRTPGFTIVELIVVISIIAILAVIGIISYGSWQRSVHAAQVKSDLQTAASEMESAKNFGDGYPLALPDGFQPGDKSLIVLWGTPSSTKFCIDGTYDGDDTVVFYIDDENAKTGAKEGTCAERTNLAPPTQPTGLAVATASTSSIQGTWSSQASTESFTFQCAVDASFITNVKSSTVAYTSTDTTITGLMEGTRYYCRLKATNAKGSSTWSETKTTSTGITPPTGLAVSNKSTTQINYSWNAVSGATQYQLQRALDSSFTVGTATKTVSGTSGTWSSLSPSSYYYFRVKALNADSQTTYTSAQTGYTTIDWGVYSTFATVGDWNGDGKNDLVGYRSDGGIYLHLGNPDSGALYGGKANFSSGYYMTNIGGDVLSLIGIGSLPSGSAPSLWWWQNDGSGQVLTSNGSTGVSGSPATSGTAGTWSGCKSVFAGRLLVPSATSVVCKSNALSTWTLSSAGVPTSYNTAGSGWESSFPGERVIGAGDWNSDGKGDIIGWTLAGAMTLYLGTNNGGVTSSTYSLSGGWSSNLIYGGWDYSGDGKVDILRYLTDKNQMCLYTGNGAVYFLGTCYYYVN